MLETPWSDLTGVHLSTGLETILYVKGLTDIWDQTEWGRLKIWGTFLNLSIPWFAQFGFGDSAGIASHSSRNVAKV
jgi:hypothetical protein